MVFNLRLVLERKDEGLLPLKGPEYTGAASAHQKRHWWAACTQFGVLYAASLYDLYRRAIRAVLAEQRAEGFMLLVLLLDWTLRALLLVFAVGRAYLFLVQDHAAIELSALGTGYVAIVVCSLAFYSAERLVGRCGASRARRQRDGVSGEDMQPLSPEDLDFVTLWQVCNRESMGWLTSGVVTALHLTLAAAGATAVLATATELEQEHNRVAYALLVHVLAADVVYTFSRLRTFHEVAKQSSIAANIAGMHTLYTVCVVAPVSVAYLIYVY